MWDQSSGSGRSPGEGNGTPLQYSCPENPTDRGAWRAIIHGDRKRVRPHLPAKQQQTKDVLIHLQLIKGCCRTAGFSFANIWRHIYSAFLQTGNGGTHPRKVSGRWQMQPLSCAGRQPSALHLKHGSTWNSLSHVQLLVTPWNIQCMEFPQARTLEWVELVMLPHHF